MSVPSGWVSVGSTKPYVTVQFFLRGDESGQMYTKEFDTLGEYLDWRREMGVSAEVFNEMY